MIVMAEVLERLTLRRSSVNRRTRAQATGAREQWAWLGAGLVFAFLVPFVFADRLGVPRDLYYSIYMIAVAGFLAGWMHASGLALSNLVRRTWAWGIGLGTLFAGVMALIVLRSEDATAHPGGATLAGAIVWRGVIYGATDGLLLSVFPIIAVFTAFRHSGLRRRLLGTVIVGTLALVVSLGMTASYHLGYSDFRSQRVTKTLAGDAVWSAPTLLTLSPLGATIAHVGLHVTAVIHSYDTELFLPPHK
jgi:hypothetical protein